jgi:hypothetical protein
MPITTQQNAEVVEPCHDTLQFHTIDQKNRQRSFLLANVIKKSVLEILCALSHQSFYPICPGCGRASGVSAAYRQKPFSIND